ncbi:hypothetical protein OUZ56_007930 [Daphnia magna]|uniref:Secreted protein n=1 Tax=Daphnia magna TaxID=35525 RepID=A0ABR0ABV0_9CRUS|nr:hypothetical protein OUZ56_007930 [Daphnia magna]
MSGQKLLMCIAAATCCHRSEKQGGSVQNGKEDNRPVRNGKLVRHSKDSNAQDLEYKPPLAARLRHHEEDPRKEFRNTKRNLSYL